MESSPPLPVADQEARRRELRTMKVRATGLLGMVTATFVGLNLLHSDAAWLPYALAAAEGSMVGGLADWFAVTALFRHPLGVPIPHTAIIRERKDQFGETLASFVRDNFLSRDVVTDRVRSLDVADRVANWLAAPDNADSLAGSLLGASVRALEVVGDDDVQRVLHEEIERLARSVDVAPLAGRLLEVATRENRHAEILNAGLRGVVTMLDEQREPLRERFGQESPWWLPDAVEDRLFDRIIDGARLLLSAVVADPNHELRVAIDARLATFADRLQHDPALSAKGHELVQEALQHEAIRTWTAGLWGDIKATLIAQSDDPRSALRTRVAGAIVGVGERLQRDDALRAKLSGWTESAAGHVIDHYGDEIGGVISATVARWDAQETSDKLELLLGRDLQFIRINGTVVGGLAGLALHGLAVALH